MTLAAIVEQMIASYGDIQLIAKTAIVDPVEVLTAFEEAKQDTAEKVCLGLLKQFHPVVEPVKIIK